jgi:HEAT repeat protein
MTNSKGYVDYYLSQLSGPEAENSWHSLVEAGPDALPYLVEAFNSNDDPQIQVRLIQIICQYRSKNAVPFLSTQLNNQFPEIWKTALDGLVSLGNTEAIEALGVAMEHVKGEKREWIEEAIQQIYESQQ